MAVKGWKWLDMANNWLGIARMTGTELKWLYMTRNFVQTSLAQPGLMFILYSFN